ncbi:AAR_G0054390.mRNA.1.CDS.1 [Saccharomyces cerevisiae]|nr:Frk1p [Saccharomyces cerevisiae YJM193]CAI4822216.1 AAR_G0054390.mRNA.1.CDS.1 [Saccharomyces cerevisiae]CAI6904079.1 AAR_G0054390.mRNA.1.CDS.1 [Saccharomyces cerevisiae]
MSYTNKRHTYYGGFTNDLSDTFQYPQRTDEQRRKHVTFGPYILGSTLGEGEFGKVKLGWPKNFSNNSNSTFDFPKQVAIKLIKRDSISNDYRKEVKIYREINALKHLSHPNIVKLEEVLQNSRYIGIVLEYACGGEFYKYIQKKRRLKEMNACRLFSQLISGVHYIHSKGLVHRDLKLENLLLDKNENLVITDFGFVNEFCSRNELMKTSCGSPCYAAPELVISAEPYEARKADIWSCGVILYAMLAGYLPWDDDPNNPEGSDIGRLYNYINSTPLKFPDYILPIPRDLLRRMLVSDPKKRINLKQIKKHEWLKPHSSFLSITPDEWDKLNNTQSVFRLAKPRRRYGSRPQSSCSTSSLGSRSDKRDSLVIDSTLITFPAPPQESQNHIITRPASIASDQRLSPIRRSNRHNRSNSAASVALQAVVNADREYVLSHEQSLSPVQNIRQTTGNMTASLSPPPAISPGDIIIETTPIKRNTISGSSIVPSLEKESSTTMQTSKIQPNNMASSQNHQYNKNKTQNSLQSAKNFYRTSSSSHTKPRPTSYHPGSYTTPPYNSNTLSIYEINEKAKSSASSQTLNQRDTSPFDSTPYLALDTCITSSSSIESSPKLITHGQFSVAKPSVDLQSVSGDLIKYKRDADVVTRIYDEKYKQKRKSLRYSGIFSDISCDTVTEESDELRPPESPLQQHEGQESIDKAKTEDTSEKGSKSSNVAKATAQKHVNNHLERSLNEAESTKKRFSFLSLYSYDTSKSSLYSSMDSKRKPSPPSQRRPKKDDSYQTNSKNHYITASNMQTSHQVSKDLPAPTMVQNKCTLETKKAVRSNRSSIMVSEVNKASVDNKAAQSPEHSTAKRVLGFFKRRSMKI